jgi:hypothetical protein
MGSKVGVIKIAAWRVGLSLDAYRLRIAEGLKWCWKCKTWQPREAFACDKTRGDGLGARCRACGYMRRRRKRVGGPDSRRAQTIAVEAIRRAIRLGRIAKAADLPCFYCGKAAAHYHHHLGYSPDHLLDVRAACPGCHHRLHFVDA